MKLPHNMTENEVVKTIDNVANKLIRKFKFGYHELDDMRQQARLIAWTKLDKYDGVRSFENFLWTVIHNGLFNFKRDNFERPDNPCDNCSSFLDNKCCEYDNVYECQTYRNWWNRNSTKRNILSPV